MVTGDGSVWNATVPVTKPKKNEKKQLTIAWNTEAIASLGSAVVYRV